MQRKPILCGSHTVDSIGRYFKSLTSLVDEYKSVCNITYRRTSANKRVQEIEQESTSAVVESPSETHRVRQATNKKRKTSLDWWSKYEKAQSRQDEGAEIRGKSNYYNNGIFFTNKIEMLNLRNTYYLLSNLGILAAGLLV